MHEEPQRGKNSGPASVAGDSGLACQSAEGNGVSTWLSASSRGVRLQTENRGRIRQRRESRHSQAPKKCLTVHFREGNAARTRKQRRTGNRQVHELADESKAASTAQTVAFHFRVWPRVAVGLAWGGRVAGPEPLKSVRLFRRRIYTLFFFFFLM